MNVDVTRPWKEVFALVAEAKAEEKRKKHLKVEFEELERQDREMHLAQEKREKKEEREQAFEQMLATAERLAEFSSHLEDLDTASVKALMDNGEALDRVNAQLGLILGKADRLPDGRRIFKTEDGKRVFDEHGCEIPEAIVDPLSLDDRHIRWEPFKALQDRKSAIEAERHEILHFQDKLDRARARLDKGGVTNKELDALDGDLKRSMPPTVRLKLGLPATGMGAESMAPADAGSLSSRLDKIVRGTTLQQGPM